MITKEDIKNLNEADARKLQTALRASIREDYDNNGRHLIAKGKEIKVVYKKATVTGIVTEIRPSSFTMKFKDGSEWKSIWRKFADIR